MDAVTNLVRRMVQPLSARVSAMIGRVALKGITEAHGLRLVQVVVREGEVRDGVEHFEPYGYTGYAPPGAEGVLVHVGGVGGHPILLVLADRRYRPKDLSEGEVALWSKFAQLFKLDKNGDIICTAPRDMVFTAGRDIKFAPVRDFDFDAGRDGHVRGTARFIYECNGHGWEILPDRVNAYTIGSVAGATNPINAPRIP